jgi:hypothetical protein
VFKPKIYTAGTVRYVAFATTGEPNTVQEALSDSKSKHAMESEIQALHDNATWPLVPAHGKENVIDSK